MLVGIHRSLSLRPGERSRHFVLAVSGFLLVIGVYASVTAWRGAGPSPDDFSLLADGDVPPEIWQEVEQHVAPDSVGAPLYAMDGVEYFLIFEPTSNLCLHGRFRMDFAEGQPWSYAIVCEEISLIREAGLVLVIGPDDNSHAAIVVPDQFSTAEIVPGCWVPVVGNIVVLSELDMSSAVGEGSTEFRNVRMVADDGDDEISVGLPTALACP